MIAILFYGGVQLENWINFDNLPRRKDGKIDWKHCNHNLVEFCYNGYEGYFYIENRISRNNLLLSYGRQMTSITVNALIKLQLRKIKRMINIEEHLKQKDVQKNEIDVYFQNSEYKYSIGHSFNLKRGELKILSYDVMSNKYKAYHVCWVADNIDFLITETALQNCEKWNVGNNYKIIPGIDDLWTVRPDVAALLQNPDDGFIYGQFTNKSIPFICPNCHKIIGEKPISVVSTYGLSCCYCGDGISYPNRLMANLLDQLDIEFEREKRFDWCVFPNYYDKKSVSYGKYDFVLCSNKIIIEMDGGIGHGNETHSKSRYSKEELEYKDEMKDLLALKNGYTVIRIDCNYSNHNKYEYCKTNIIDSLSRYIDLSDVNWNDVNKESAKSILLEAVEMYNCGKEAFEISKLLKRDYTTIIDYLHKGTKLGICEFIPQCA